MAEPFMICPHCKKPTHAKVKTHHYVESGLKNVWLSSCISFRCKKCKVSWALLPDANKVTSAIARQLLEQDVRFNADEVLFLRKAFCVTAKYFAEMLGTERAEISRWENGKAAISPLADLKLRVRISGWFLTPDERNVATGQILRLLEDGHKEDPRPHARIDIIV